MSWYYGLHRYADVLEFAQNSAELPESTFVVSRGNNNGIPCTCMDLVAKMEDIEKD